MGYGAGIEAGAVLRGDLVYALQSAKGLDVLDLSNLADPRLVAHLQTTGYAGSVTVAGNRVYVSLGEDGLIIARSLPDAATPSASPTATSWPTPQTPTPASPSPTAVVPQGGELFLPLLYRPRSR